jgi:hypothetical protein
MKKVTVEFTHGTKSHMYIFCPLVDCGSSFNPFLISFYMSIRQQPKRRRSSPRLSSYWILVADRTGSALEKYHLVQLDGRNITENTVESSFPHCIIQRMPSYKNNILSAIKTKSLYCSFCYEYVLDYIGKMATKYSCSQLLQLFDSEESFIIECIELVYCCYIFFALQSHKNDASRPM